MLTFRHKDNLEVSSYLNSNFISFVDSRKSTAKYIFLLVGVADTLLCVKICKYKYESNWFVNTASILVVK